MVNRLVEEGYWVRGVDLKEPEFSPSRVMSLFVEISAMLTLFLGSFNLKDRGNFYNSIPYRSIQTFDEICQFAADMGGAGFVFTGENDADIVHTIPVLLT